MLQPLAVETFLNEIWAKTHYHVKRCCAGYFDNLLPGPATVDELLELFHREPTSVRLMRGKDRKLGPDRYQVADGSLDLVSIRNDFADGYTIVLDSVERYVRAVATLSHSIEVELNFPIQANAYITPPRSQGLTPHFDDHDVLILQIRGSKLWHLYDGADIAPHELRREEKAVAADDLPLPTNFRVEAGDVLYVPRGKVHAAETNSEPSIHLTVGIHPPTVAMLAIGAIYSRSFHDDGLNALLPPRHLDDANVQASLDVLVRDALKTVEDPSAITGGLDLLADVLARRGRCPPIGSISNATGIGEQTLVKKYEPLYSWVKTVADGVVLQFASLSVGAGADHKAAMLFISRSTQPFRVRDLPGLNTQQQIDLARSLIVSGFLVRLPDDSDDRLS